MMNTAAYYMPHRYYNEQSQTHQRQLLDHSSEGVVVVDMIDGGNRLASQQKQQQQQQPYRNITTTSNNTASNKRSNAQLPVVSPLGSHKPTVSSTLPPLPNDSTEDTGTLVYKLPLPILVPPPALPVAAPAPAPSKLYVHIMFDGCMVSSSAQNNDTTVVMSEGGGGALLTLLSIPQGKRNNNGVSRTSTSSDISTIKMYRIRQYFTTTSVTEDKSTTTDGVKGTSPSQSTPNRYLMYYIACNAALRVLLRHMQKHQPTTLSPQHTQDNYPYNTIDTIQIEGSMPVVMNTIQFLTRYPIVSQSSSNDGSSTTTTTADPTTTNSNRNNANNNNIKNPIEPLLQHQFNLCHSLLQQLKFFCCNSKTRSGGCDDRMTIDHEQRFFDIVQFEQEDNIRAEALAKEAIDQKRSWVTQSDDYHSNEYVFTPTTILEPCLKKRSYNNNSNNSKKQCR